MEDKIIIKVYKAEYSLLVNKLNSYSINVPKEFSKEVKAKFNKWDESIMMYINVNTNEVWFVEFWEPIKWHYLSSNIIYNPWYYYVYRVGSEWPKKKHLFKEIAIAEAFRLSNKEKCEFEILKKVWQTKMEFIYEK